MGWNVVNLIEQLSLHNSAVYSAARSSSDWSCANWCSTEAEATVCSFILQETTLKQERTMKFLKRKSPVSNFLE